MRSLGPAAMLAALALAGASCRMPVGVSRKPGDAPRCDRGVCAEIVFFQSHVDDIGMWIEAPPATRLLNARVAAGERPACQGQFPVEWVRVDDTLHRTGPVDIGGGHGVVLGFPINTWWDHSGYWREMFVDVELEVGGSPRCLRTRLTRADGKEALGS